MVKAIDQAVKEEQTDWKAKLAEVQGKLDSRDEELDRKEKALKDREKEARANTAYDISEQFTESYVRELMDQFFSTIIPSSQDSGTVQLETMDNQQLDFLKAVTLLREANDRGHELIEKAINKLVSRLRETAEELV